MLKRRSNTLLNIVIFITVLVIFSPEATAQSVESLSLNERTISINEELIDLEQLDANENEIIPFVTEDYPLEGLIDGVQSYYEVPPQGLKANNYIELSLSYSSLLLKGSNVTINVDNKPIESVALDPKETTLKVKVPLEGDAVEPGFHNISISFYGHLEEDVCINEESSANWLVVLSASHLVLDAKEMEVRENALNDYPYPYIQNNSLDMAKSKIVIPNNASENTLTVAFKLSNYLHKQTSSEEIIPIVREDEIKEISTHLIAIGAIDEWDEMIHSLVDEKITTAVEDKMMLQTFFMDVEDKVKQLLFVTASESETINEKITLMTEDDFVKQLSGNEIAIDELPTIERKIEQKVPLTELEMTSTTLSGKFQGSSQYFYKIPTYIDENKNATLHLKLKVSETLLNQEQNINTNNDAELLVNINDIPHSISINDLKKSEDSDLIEIDIPVDASTFKGEAYLSLQLYGNGLRNDDYCTKPTDAHWIYVQDDSYLNFSLLEQGDNDRFLTWPSPFVTIDDMNSTAVIIPNEVDSELIKQMQTLIHQLGSHAHIDNIQFVYLSNVTDELLLSSNIIVINDHQVYKSILQQESLLLLQQDDKNEKLQLSKYGFVNDLAKSIAWIQPSIWNNQYGMAVFSPVHFDNHDMAIGNNIMKFLDEKSLNVNVIVENRNGEIFTNQLEEVEDVKEEKEPSAILKFIEDKNYIPFVFGGVILLSIIIFFYALRKRKRKVNRS